LLPCELSWSRPLYILVQLLMTYQSRGQGLRLKKDPLRHRIDLQGEARKETVDKIHGGGQPKVDEIVDRIDEFGLLLDRAKALLAELIKEGHAKGQLPQEPDEDEEHEEHEEDEEDEEGEGEETENAALESAFRVQTEEDVRVAHSALVAQSGTDLEEMADRLAEIDGDVEIMSEALNRLVALGEESAKKKASRNKDE
jgi:hypothetical protein